MMAGMANIELDPADAPACPLLGLAKDSRSHFTYPHPGHRCFAAERPATTDARRQATYCLSPAYSACDRYQAQRHRAQTRVGWEPREASREASARPSSTPASALAAPGSVIHVLRAGDSLVRIAATYGLTVEQITSANGLTPKDSVPHGTRLVIPIGSPAASRRQARTRVAD
jgi:LysM repeat protein